MKFMLQTKVVAYIDVPVKAKTLEEAAAKAKDLKFEELVNFTDANIVENDTDVSVSGIYQQS
jgi:uncharacterized membrane protein